MIDFKQFTKQDGTIDWAAHKKAQVAAGEVCSKCSTHILSFALFGNPRPAAPRLCGSCKALTEDREEVTSDSFVRCPACGHQMDAYDLEINGEGSHDVSCGECEHDFEVQVSMSVSYESPAMLEKKEQEAEA